MGNSSCLSTLLENGDLWPALSEHQHVEEDRSFYSLVLAKGKLHEFSFFPAQEEHSHSSAPTLLLSHLVTQHLRSLAQASHLSYADFFSPRGFQKFIVWVGKASWPNPAIFEKHFSFLSPEERTYIFSRFLFLDVEKEKDFLWIIEILLRSQAVSFLLGHGKHFSFSISRRFAVLAQRYAKTFLYSTECIASKNLASQSTFSESFLQTLPPSSAQSRWIVYPAHSSFCTDKAVFTVELLHMQGLRPAEARWACSFSLWKKYFGFSIFPAQETQPYRHHSFLEKSYGS